MLTGCTWPLQLALEAESFETKDVARLNAVGLRFHANCQVIGTESDLVCGTTASTRAAQVAFNYAGIPLQIKRQAYTSRLFFTGKQHEDMQCCFHGLSLVLPVSMRHAHRCPFWVSLVKHRWHWFIPFIRAVYLSKRPPMSMQEIGKDQVMDGVCIRLPGGV